MKHRKEKTKKERSYFDGTRRVGLLAGILVGVAAAGIGTYNVVSEVARWERDFTSNIDAIVDGESASRFAITSKQTSTGFPLVYHMYYGGGGLALALGCALVSSMSKNRGYNPMPKADLPFKSFAQKNESGRYVIRVKE